ncbi:hypothetical protein ACYU03_11300 [Pseudomonas sp. X10]
MEPAKCPTTQLKHSLRQLMQHDVSNPDDDPHWSGVMFFCATDEHTRALIEKIEILASEAFFDPRGRAIMQHVRAAAIEGVRVKQLKDAPADETIIRICLPSKAYITVSAARL